MQSLEHSMLLELGLKGTDGLYLTSHANVIIAGGAFTSLYHGEPVKDYDVFILGDEFTTDLFMHKIEIMKQDFPDRFIDSDLNYLNNGNNTRNITYITLDTKTKIQYIFTKYLTRQELLKSFDAQHACISYQGEKLHVSPLTMDCIKRKIIKAHNGNVIAQWRVDKFQKKGFKFEIDLV
jgi:hypothetical protein